MSLVNALLVDRYFLPEREAIEILEGQQAAVEQQLQEQIEEHGGEDGLLEEVIEGELRDTETVVPPRWTGT